MAGILFYTLFYQRRDNGCGYTPAAGWLKQICITIRCITQLPANAVTHQPIQLILIPNSA